MWPGQAFLGVGGKEKKGGSWALGAEWLVRNRSESK